MLNKLELKTTNIFFEKDIFNCFIRVENRKKRIDKLSTFNVIKKIKFPNPKLSMLLNKLK